MPFRKKYRSYRRKRMYRQKRRRRGPRPYNSRVRGTSGFPDSISTKLKFVQMGAISTGGNIDQIIYRGNGPFDPEVAASTGECLDFARYAALYQEYACVASKMKVTMLPITNTPALSSIIWGVLPNNDSSVTFTEEDIVEQPLSRWKTMNALYGAGRNQSISYYMTTQKMKGITKQALTDDTYRSLVTIVPASQWYWHLLTATVDGSSIPAANFIVEITYYVKFFNRKATV